MVERFISLRRVLVLHETVLGEKSFNFWINSMGLNAGIQVG
jgi:hypothetical protein